MLIENIVALFLYFCFRAIPVHLLPTPGHSADDAINNSLSIILIELSIEIQLIFRGAVVSRAAETHPYKTDTTSVDVIARSKAC